MIALGLALVSFAARADESGSSGYTGPADIPLSNRADGAIVDLINVARFTARAPAIPTRPPVVRLVPTGTNVVAVWGRSTGNVERVP